MYAAPGEHTGFTPVASAAKMEESDPEAVPTIIKEPTSPLPAVNDVELSPLLPPQSPLPGQVTQPAVRPKGRFPLVRQQSAPPGSMLPVRGLTPGVTVSKPPPPVLNNLPELPEFPDVQLRKKSFRNSKRSRPNSGESTNSGSLDPDATAQAFRKALRTTSSNQYKRVHDNPTKNANPAITNIFLSAFLQVYQKHNRNLIGDDDMPELEMVLRRRLSSVSTPYSVSGRLPQAISSVFNSPLSSPGTPTTPKSPSHAAAANPATSSFESTSFPFSGKKYFMAMNIDLKSCY